MTASVHLINYPAKVPAQQARETERLRRELEELLSEYRFTPGGAVARLNVGLLHNKRLKAVNAIEVGPKVRVVQFNYPRVVSFAEDTENSTFLARLQRALEDYRLLPGGGLHGLDVLLVYNKELADLNISGLDGADGREWAAADAPEFVPSAPKYRLDQVVLGAELLEDIYYTLSILQNRKVIYEDWGFDEIDPAPRAVLNFYGPPGTGKTMAAHAIAHHLRSKILLLNYSDIESKYVGDAPKNLVRAFRTGAAEGAVLFFDEADSFLGKRVTNISSSSDQAVNSLRSQMLIQLDSFQGVVIFATNLIKNYDRAFESRIFRHLKFDLPDAAQRAKIIRKVIPRKAPVCEPAGFSDEFVESLVGVSEGFSGREIKNAVLGALSAAAALGCGCLGGSDLETSFRKLRKTVDDLRRENEGPLSPERKKALEEKIAARLSDKAARESADAGQASAGTPVNAPEP